MAEPSDPMVFGLMDPGGGRVAHDAPKLSGNWLLGQYPEFRDDPLAVFLRAMREVGDYAWLRFAHIPVLLVNEPEGVRAILEERADNYPRESESPRIMRQFIGDGILTANGQDWRDQRSALEPHLHRPAVERHFQVMSQEICAALDEWAARSADGRILDVARATKVVGLTTICQLLFGYRPSLEEAEQFTDHVTYGQEDVLRRLFSLIDPPLALPIARNVKLKEALRFAHAFCTKVVERGQRRFEKRGDYLEAVLRVARSHAAPGEAGPNLFWARQMMMTLMIVGSENPSNTVSWALALLASHPEVLKTLRSELTSELGSRPVQLDDIPKLKRLRCVLNETLRLYPGGRGLDRRATAEDVPGGVRVPRGSVVFVAPYLMHRNPDVWRNAWAFDPDRWLPERKEPVPRFGWFPFGGGGHQCLGPVYAYQFMSLFLAEFLRRFDFALDPNHPLLPQALFTLRPKGGVRLTLHPRAQVARA